MPSDKNLSHIHSSNYIIKLVQERCGKTNKNSEGLYVCEEELYLKKEVKCV